MAFTALELINRAYFLSGVVSRSFEEVSGPQSADGLYYLNLLLDYSTPNSRLIPYWTRYDFSLSNGVEKYFVENLVEIETFTFNIGTIRYSVIKVSRDQYFSTPRVDNITSIPSIWFGEKALGGMNIYVYFLPGQNYPAQITGKFALPNVDFTTDLSLYYDRYYTDYLLYALANELCFQNNVLFAPNKKERLDEMIAQLSFRSPPDLTMNKFSLIGNNRGSINYQQANIGKGFFP